MWRLRSIGRRCLVVVCLWLLMTLAAVPAVWADDDTPTASNTRAIDTIGLDQEDRDSYIRSMFDDPSSILVTTQSTDSSGQVSQVTYSILNLTQKYLQYIFGDVNGLFGSGAPYTVMNYVFTIYNTALVGLIAVLFAMGISFIVFDSARDGDVMEHRKSFYSDMFRAGVGVSSLAPMSTGYSALQTLVMTVVLAGNSLANTLWSNITLYAFDYGLVSNPCISDASSTASSQIANSYNLAKNIYRSQVCYYYYQAKASQQEADDASHGYSTNYTVSYSLSDNQLTYEIDDLIKDNSNNDNPCGLYDGNYVGSFGDNTDTVASSRWTYFQQLFNDMDTLANSNYQYTLGTGSLPDCDPNGSCSLGEQIYSSAQIYDSNIGELGNSYSSNNQNNGIPLGFQLGWAMAGATYLQLLTPSISGPFLRVEPVSIQAYAEVYPLTQTQERCPSEASSEDYSAIDDYNSNIRRWSLYLNTASISDNRCAQQNACDGYTSWPYCDMASSTSYTDEVMNDYSSDGKYNDDIRYVFQCGDIAGKSAMNCQESGDASLTDGSIESFEETDALLRSATVNLQKSYSNSKTKTVFDQGDYNSVIGDQSDRREKYTASYYLFNQFPFALASFWPSYKNPAPGPEESTKGGAAASFITGFFYSFHDYVTESWMAEDLNVFLYEVTRAMETTLLLDPNTTYDGDYKQSPSSSSFTGCTPLIVNPFYALQRMGVRIVASGVNLLSSTIQDFMADFLYTMATFSRKIMIFKLIQLLIDNVQNNIADLSNIVLKIVKMIPIFGPLLYLIFYIIFAIIIFLVTTIHNLLDIPIAFAMAIFNVRLVSKFLIYYIIIVIPMPVILLVLPLTLYSVMIPTLVYTFGVIGWFLMVVEAMIATPLVGVAMVMRKQGSDLLGQAQAAILMLVQLALLPTFLMIGFVSALALLFAMTWFIANTVFVYLADMLNTLFVNAIQGSGTTTTVSGTMGFYILILIYIKMIALIFFQMIDYCMSFTYHLKSTVMRYLGLPPERADEQYLMQEMQRGFSEGTNSFGGTDKATGDKATGAVRSGAQK